MHQRQIAEVEALVLVAEDLREPASRRQESGGLAQGWLADFGNLAMRP
jgi:hypothetical protein